MDRNPTSTQLPPPRYTASKPVDLSRQPLRHARRPVYVLLAYLLFLLVPWICICIVNGRIASDPFGILMEYQIESYHRWMRLASFLGTVAAVIALPCVALLSAHGAVVYAQRRSHQQSLSVRQLVALADGRWTAVFTKGDASVYLGFATGLLLLAAVQLPLQSLLMPTSTRVVYPCRSAKYLTKWDRSCDGDGTAYQAQKVGKEPEPALLRQVDEVPGLISSMRSKMASISSADIQQYLWRDGNNHRSFTTGVDQKYNDSFWVSAIPAGTATGPLRQHSIRLSSTSDCQLVSHDDFPATCNGYTTSIDGFGVSIRVCMPVEAAEHAAERSPLPPRRRQDIEETLFIEARIGPEAAQASDFESISADNFTVKCAARTTRAFFELPNLHTDLRPSAPIDEWPLDEDMEAKFHDYDWDGNLITRDWKEGWNRDVYSGWTSSQGPLRSTVEALLGNESYPRVMLDFLGETFPDGNIPDNFNTSDEASRASQRKGCAIDPPLRAWQLPYNSRNDKFDDWYPSIYNGCTLKKLPKSLFRMAQGLQHSAVSTLGVGMYLANVGVLQDAASSDAARMIYNLTGADFVAPRYNFGAVFTLSVLLGLQVLLLALLTYYIYSLPTWTDTLDGIAMMRIGTQLRDSALLTPLRRVDEDDMVRLGEIDGLVGVVPRPGSTPEDDLELAAMATTLRQSMGASHQYEIVRPASPASTVPSVDLPAVPQQTRQPAQSTLPGMSASDFSSYLQGGGLTSPVSSVPSSAASSVRSASPPPPYLPATTSNREQRARLPYELGVGAQGLVLKALWKKYDSK